MSILEEKIKKNKDYFDFHEPSGKHKEKFREKLTGKEAGQGKMHVSFSLALKIAASLVVIAVVAVLLMDIDPGNKVLADDVMINNEEIPKELKEVKTYYQSLTSKKLEQIENISCSESGCEKLKDIAQEEIIALNRNNQKLEKDLAESNNDRRVMNAIVSNYELMSKLLDKVIVNMNKIN